MKRIAVLLVLILSLSSVAASGKEIKGYNGLYMGHSFFWPSVEKLEKIIPDSTIVGHKQALVRSGGAGGSAGNLWQNEKKRAEGQRHLNTKKIDLLVMTYHSPQNSSAEHYVKWFDYAIAQNPKTTFMITIPWAGKRWSDATLRPMLKMGGQLLCNTLVAELREKYPENKVLFCHYGLGTYELIDRFEAGNLPGVKHLLDKDPKTRKESKAKKEQLLNDPLGHPGELVAMMGALLWMQTLYDYDLTTLKTKRIKELPDIDYLEIADTVSKKNKPFNAVYKGK